MTEDYQWLVDNRAKAQVLLLEAYNFLRNKRSALNTQEMQRSVFSLLAGAAFSLWRAVFLAQEERDWENTLGKAEEFLLRVIKDNTITFTHESNLRAWSVGYYLNNSYYRLNSALNELLGINNESELRIRQTISKNGNELQPLNIAQMMSNFDDEAHPLLWWFLKKYADYDIPEHVDTDNIIMDKKELADALADFLKQFRKGIAGVSDRDVWTKGFQAANAVFTLLTYSRVM